MYGYHCFEKAMENITIENNCNCPIECNSVSYSFSFVSTPFDHEEMCPSDRHKEDFLMKEFYDNKFPPQFIRKMREFKGYKDNVSSDARENCYKNIKYRAEIIFTLATDSISVTVMSRRLSFFDKMSAFGKIFFSSLI